MSFSAKSRRCKKILCALSQERDGPGRSGNKAQPETVAIRGGSVGDLRYRPAADRRAQRHLRYDRRRCQVTTVSDYAPGVLDGLEGSRDVVHRCSPDRSHRGKVVGDKGNHRGLPLHRRLRQGRGLVPADVPAVHPRHLRRPVYGQAPVPALAPHCHRLRRKFLSSPIDPAPNTRCHAHDLASPRTHRSPSRDTRTAAPPTRFAPSPRPGKSPSPHRRSHPTGANDAMGRW
jgi:hypothetical protein